MSKLFRNIILVRSHHSPLSWKYWAESLGILNTLKMNSFERSMVKDIPIRLNSMKDTLYEQKLQVCSSRSENIRMDDQLQSSSLCFINTRQLGNESYVVISLNCRMDWGYIRAIVYIFCFWFICLLVFVFMEYFKLFTRNNKVSRLLVNLNRLSMMYFMFPCDQFSILLMGRRCTLSV